MAIIYREEKGSPLTISELDGNFRDLSQRLLALETSGLQAEGIEDIQVQDDKMTMVGTKGTLFGPFFLPKAFFQARGNWKEGTAYAGYDLVTVGTKIYVCQVPHTAQDFNREQQYWSLLVDFSPLIKTQAKTSPSAPLSKGLLLYENATLPEPSKLGALGLLIDQKEGASLVYSDGRSWLHLKGFKENEDEKGKKKGDN